MLVLRGVLFPLLPEELSLPEPNSYRSVWDTVINFGLGNPRMDSDRTRYVFGRSDGRVGGCIKSRM